MDFQQIAVFLSYHQSLREARTTELLLALIYPKEVGGDPDPIPFLPRPLAIGRKNWLFVGNEDGGKASAIVLSLVQTCRGLGINPREYLEDVMRRLMSHNAKKLDELLPDRWLAARKTQL